MSKQFEFSMIDVCLPIHVFLNTKLNDIDFKIFWAISCLSPGKWKPCTVNDDYFTRCFQLSKSKVRESITKLVKYGYIKKSVSEQTRILYIAESYTSNYYHIVKRFNDFIQSQRFFIKSNHIKKPKSTLVSQTSPNYFINVCKNERTLNSQRQPFEDALYNTTTEIPKLLKAWTRVEASTPNIQDPRDFTKRKFTTGSSYYTILIKILDYLTQLRKQKNSDKDLFSLYIDYITAVYDRLEFMISKGRNPSVTHLSPSDSQRFYFEDTWIPEVELKWEERYWYRSSEFDKPERWDYAGKKIE